MDCSIDHNINVHNIIIIMNFYFNPGTSALLSAHHQLCELIDEGDEDEESRTDCNKETGEKKQLRKWTRGVWMCVSGGGLIQTWQPL